MHLIIYLKKYWSIIFGLFALCMFIKPVLCFLILGLLFLCIGVSGILAVNKLHKHGTECTGKIIAIESDSDGDKIPMVQFKTKETGQIVTEKPFLYTSSDITRLRSNKYIIDTDIPILYDPGDPTQFILANRKSPNNVAFAVFTLFGIATTAASIASLLGYINIGF